MTTSGTTAFVPDVAEIIEEAFERVRPSGSSTGYDVRTARRSINLLMLEWANRGVNLWTIDSGTVALVSGTSTYSLPADTIDLLDVVIRTTAAGVQNDMVVGRISLNEYTSIPSKTATGRPVQFMVNRLSAAPTITLWPTPDSATTYSLVYWRMRRIQDTGGDGGLTMDVPARLIPALISGLAYYLGMKYAPGSLQVLKAMYDEQFQMAVEEDRDRASFRLVPRPL